MKWVHVNPEEAIKIHKDIGSLKSVGMHWGTFKLTYENYLEPKTLTRSLAEAEGIDFQVVDLGHTVTG